MNARAAIFLLFGLLTTIALGLLGLGSMTQSPASPVSTIAPPANPIDEFMSTDQVEFYENPFETTGDNPPYSNPFE